MGGSIAFVLAATVGSVLYTQLFAFGGFFDSVPIVVCVCVALSSSIVELCPVEDNVLVPVSAVVVSELLLAAASGTVL
jgi:dolichol kinase